MLNLKVQIFIQT